MCSQDDVIKMEFRHILLQKKTPLMSHGHDVIIVNFDACSR